MIKTYTINPILDLNKFNPGFKKELCYQANDLAAQNLPGEVILEKIQRMVAEERYNRYGINNIQRPGSLEEAVFALCSELQPGSVNQIPDLVGMLLDWAIDDAWDLHYILMEVHNPECNPDKVPVRLNHLLNRCNPFRLIQRAREDLFLYATDVETKRILTSLARIMESKVQSAMMILKNYIQANSITAVIGFSIPEDELGWMILNTGYRVLSKMDLIRLNVLVSRLTPVSDVKRVLEKIPSVTFLTENVKLEKEKHKAVLIQGSQPWSSDQDGLLAMLNSEQHLSELEMLTHYQTFGNLPAKIYLDLNYFNLIDDDSACAIDTVEDFFRYRGLYMDSFYTEKQFNPLDDGLDEFIEDANYCDQYNLDITVNRGIDPLLMAKVVIAAADCCGYIHIHS